MSQICHLIKKPNFKLDYNDWATENTHKYQLSDSSGVKYKESIHMLYTGGQFIVRDFYALVQTVCA